MLFKVHIPTHTKKYHANCNSVISRLILRPTLTINVQL